jgi:sulfur oxidation c-type cytochrome SoxX
MNESCRNHETAPSSPLAGDARGDGLSVRGDVQEEGALTCRFAATSPAGRRGKRRSRRSRLLRRGFAALALIALSLASRAEAEDLVSYTVEGDGIPASLTGAPGDARRGRALVTARTTTCILCHSGPFPETRFQGDLAPDLTGAGTRWTPSQLRLRLVDGSRLNAATIMPSYYRIDGLVRVARNVGGKPILSAAEIEDIVAYLATLRD